MKGVAFVVILELNHLQRTSIEVTAGVDEENYRHALVRKSNQIRETAWLLSFDLREVVLLPNQWLESQEFRTQ